MRHGDLSTKHSCLADLYLGLNLCERACVCWDIRCACVLACVLACVRASAFVWNVFLLVREVHSVVSWDEGSSETVLESIMSEIINYVQDAASVSLMLS